MENNNSCIREKEKENRASVSKEIQCEGKVNTFPIKNLK